MWSCSIVCRSTTTQLREAAIEAATNASLKAGRQAPPPPLLSFDIETVSPGSLRISSAPELPPELAGTEPAPRLRARRQAGGTVELSLRQVRDLLGGGGCFLPRVACFCSSQGAHGAALC